jgi:hypothetical protein
MSVKTSQWVWNKYLKLMIDDGRLKMTLPKDRQSKNLRFVSGDVAVPTEAVILEFCTELKTRKEIIEHFGLTDWTAGLTSSRWLIAEN